MPAIVAKIDMQIYHSITVQSEFCCFFSFLRRAAVWQEKDEATVGVKAPLHML